MFKVLNRNVNLKLFHLLTILAYSNEMGTLAV
jgi:hypothetical protein